jgi:hypothetical protein
MELTEAAFIARDAGNEVSAREFFEQAFVLERHAAESLRGQFELEPTRSVLYRSAATLALDCGNTKEAERLAYMGLAGHPPREIAEELHALVDRLTFDRHLRVRGIILAQEVQMSLSGESIGPGLASIDLVIQKVRDTSKLLTRTAERWKGETFRETGRPKSEITRNFETYWSAPRDSSFAVTLRLGKPDPQLILPEITDSERIIDEFLTCLQLFNEGDHSELQNHIQDEAYFRNFAGLATSIAPDGKKINLVGFTAVRENGERTASLTRRADEIAVTEMVPKTRVPSTNRRPRQEHYQTIRGELQAADKRAASKGQIILVDKMGVGHKLFVPLGLMDDLVKPHWGELVEVDAVKKGRVMTLLRVRYPGGEDG